MKACTTWLICLTIIALCGLAHANPNLLEQLQPVDKFFDPNLVHDLYDLGDGAVPFLIKSLSEQDRHTRQKVIYYLKNYYSDPRTLSALSVAFLHDIDQDVRRSAAEAIANIDIVYAKKLLGKHLNSDIATQNIVVGLLAVLKDERVIPILVSRMENVNAPHEVRGFAIDALADFKDERAVPYLLDRLLTNFRHEVKKNAAEKLAYIGDDRAISALLKVIDTRIGKDVKDIVPQLEPSTVTPLLEKLKQTESSNVREWILRAFRHARNSQLVPIYEKAHLETDDFELQLAIVEALHNMGTEGMESLMSITHQTPNPALLDALSTYNTNTAIDVLASLVLDESFQLRTQAIKALIQCGGLHKTEILKNITPLLSSTDPNEKIHILESLKRYGKLWEAEIIEQIPHLLEDPSQEVRIRTIDLIRKMKLIQMIPALEQLTQNRKGNTQYAAYVALDELLGKTPLRLEIEMSKPRYKYGDAISLTYSIRNVSDHPIKFGFRKTLSSSYLKLKIQQPDDTVANYQGRLNRFVSGRPDDNEHLIVMDGEEEVLLTSLNSNDYNILQPKDVLTGIIPVSKDYRLFQPGRYTIQLKVFLSPWKFTSFPKVTFSGKTPPLSKRVKSNFMAWEKPLISSEEHFKIDSPTPEQFRTMLTAVVPDEIQETNVEQTAQICYQLGELRKPEAMDTLKLLKALPIDIASNLRLRTVESAAGRALLNYSDPELVQIWIEMLDLYVYDSLLLFDVINKLATIGDVKAVEPLRRVIFKSRDDFIKAKAALALQKLGDDSGVRWLKSAAYLNLRHWDRNVRLSGANILFQLNPANTHFFQAPYNLRKARFFTENYVQFSLRNTVIFGENYPQFSLRSPWFYAEIFDQTINWAAIQEKAATLSGLKELLKHENPIIQHVAAYDLAYLGDKSGMQLIEQDLYANDSVTRLHARDTLLKLLSE